LHTGHTIDAVFAVRTHVPRQSAQYTCPQAVTSGFEGEQRQIEQSKEDEEEEEEEEEEDVDDEEWGGEEARCGEGGDEDGDVVDGSDCSVVWRSGGSVRTCLGEGGGEVRISTGITKQKSTQTLSREKGY
jgi:hypothetical protein